MNGRKHMDIAGIVGEKVEQWIGLGASCAQ